MTTIQIITLLISLVEQASRVAALAQKLQSEGRDPTFEEWAELDALLKLSQDRLSKAIAVAGG